MTTPRLQMTELIASQSEPHVPINAALRELDALVQLSVIDVDLAAPPGSPGDGDCYIVAASATGAWAGHEHEIAYFSGGWKFTAPRVGFTAFVEDEAVDYRFVSGSPGSWEVVPTGGGGGGGGGSPAPGDAADITYDPTASGLSATNVQDAIDEVAASGGGGGGSPANDAADVSYDPTASGLSSTNVQDAIDEVAAAGGGGGGGSAVILAASISTSQDDWAPTGWDATVTVLLVTCPSGSMIKGLDSTGRSNGSRVTVINSAASAAGVQMNDEQTSSAAGNRIRCIGFTVIARRSAVDLIWSEDDNRWYLMNGAGG